MVEPPSDDAILLAAWRDGDAEAGNQLVTRRMPEIIRFFRNKVATESDVADLVNQTFLGCVAAMQGFRGETSFRRFLYQIAQNVLFSYIRKRSKRAREQLDFGELCVRELAPDSASSILTRRRETQALVDALREIAVEDQLVLELMYFEGWTGAQIAESLELPEGTVRGRIRRGLARLRERVALELGRTGKPVTVTAEDLEGWAAEVRGRVEDSAGGE
ncbi:MAG: sigma-70 family RNA polymerase sigma factor [Myxococcales bacterium]|nr:sigma-70 family RNA polymerase sigma factor [Myxococcales bacterium]